MTKIEITPHPEPENAVSFEYARKTPGIWKRLTDNKNRYKYLWTLLGGENIVFYDNGWPPSLLGPADPSGKLDKFQKANVKICISD